jgi:hypothetical protein
MNSKSLLTSIKELLAASQYQKVIDLLKANREKTSSNYYAFVQEYCNKKLGFFHDPYKCVVTASVDKALDEDKHLIDSTFDIVLFVGRFRSVTGYGKATRDFFSALYEFKPTSYKVVGVDSQNLNLLGDTEFVKSAIDKNNIELVSVDSSSIIHVVFHELCDSFNRILVHGKSTYSAWTIQEHASMIFGKDNLLGLPQHIFVASQWNKSLLMDRGFASDFISVVPHISPKSRNNDLHNLDLASRTKFLAIMSNVERKNIRSILSAFIEISNKKDKSDISLTLKMPKHLESSEIKNKVLPSGISSLESLPSSIQIIQEKYTDAEMHHLIESHDCIINVESLKGFDLDTLYALSCGKQAISTLSGGNAEYQNKENSYIVELDLPQVFSKYNYTNQIYSKVVAFEPSISSIINQVFNVCDDLRIKSPKNTPETAKELSLQYSPDSIASLFYDNLQKRSHDYDVISLDNAEVKLSLVSSEFKHREFISDKMTEQEILYFHKNLKLPSDHA